MGKQFGHDTYLSPFSWRYGSQRMRMIWSEIYKRKLWRRIWVALAKVQAQVGLVTEAQVRDLEAHQEDIDIQRAHELESELRHDLMAEVRVYAEQCPIGGGIIHLGATSMDIEDNADALRIREALQLIRKRVRDVLDVLAKRIETYAQLPVMGYTHLQPAEPTTLGYRLAQYAQDLLMDLDQIERVLIIIRGKGFKGAVGTSASYAELLAGRGMTPKEMEHRVLALLGLEAFDVTTQTYPRKLDYYVLTCLAGIAQSAYKFALDLRLLQSPVFGELAEPFGRHQVGSSAMPFKRNPINAENICSLSRYVAGLTRAAWDNAAHSALERTLDDSANRRAILPDSFLATDEILRRWLRLVQGMVIHEEAIRRNLRAFAPFSAMEPLLMRLVQAGADRQEMHEHIRELSMRAWQAICQGLDNPLVDLAASSPRIIAYLTPDQVRRIVSEGAAVGDTPTRCRELAQKIRTRLATTH